MLRSRKSSKLFFIYKSVEIFQFTLNNDEDTRISISIFLLIQMGFRIHKRQKKLHVSAIALGLFLLVNRKSCGLTF